MVDYNRAVEIEANETVLLNVIRSRFKTATHYTSTNSITAQLKAERQGRVAVGFDQGGTVRSANGAGATTSLTDAPDLISGSAGYTLTYSQQPTFSIAVHNSPAFARGTSSPVSDEIFANLVAQGYRQNMLSHLLVEAFLIKEKGEGGRYWRIVNPNGRYANGCRDALFDRLVATVEFTPSAKVSERAPVAIFDAGSVDLAALAALTAQGYEIEPGENATLRLMGKHGGTSSELRYNGAELWSVLRASSQQCASLSARSSEWSAGGSELAALSAELADPAAELELAWVLRSVDGLVYAMGEYLRDKEQCPVDADCRTVRIDGDDIFLVERRGLGAETGMALAYTEYLDSLWVVPLADARGGHRTMQVVNLIQKLLNLNKSADELRTPAFIQVD